MATWLFPVVVIIAAFVIGFAIALLACAACALSSLHRRNWVVPAPALPPASVVPISVPTAPADLEVGCLEKTETIASCTPSRTVIPHESP